MVLARLIAIATAISACRGGFDSQEVVPDAAPDAPSADAEASLCGDKDVSNVELSGQTIGSTADESNDFFGSCTGEQGAETVLALEVDDAVEAVAIDVSNYSFDAALYVRTNCTPSPTAELACTSRSSIIFDAPASGTVFVFVDSGDTEAGPFTLQATRFDRRNSVCGSDPSRRCNLESDCIDGTCQAARCDDALPQTDAFMASGTTDGAPSLHVGSCSGGGALAPEIVYEITLTADVSDLSAATDFPGTEYDTLLYLRTACDGGEIACNDDIGDGNNRSLLSSGPLTAGTYFLVVDGFGTSDGSFELEVTLTP